MCKKLKNIQGKTAEEILNIYGQDGFNQLLLNIGISALPLDLKPIEKKVRL